MKKTASAKKAEEKKTGAATKDAAVKKRSTVSEAKLNKLAEQKAQIKELKAQVKALEKKLARIRNITE